MTGRAIVQDVRMIDKCAGETIGVMAISTIGGGYLVGGHCGRLGGRINTIVIVVAGFARLYRRIDDAVVENATEAEGCGAMARGAIDERYGMADSLTGRTNTVAGIAPVTHNIRAGVVGEGVFCVDAQVAVDGGP